MTEPTLKIVRLEVENVKRLRALTITPHGSTVILGGRNAQGKTSVLDAIEMVLGGSKTLPTEPIRRGAKQASIIADLGDLVVERVITKTGTKLTVRDKDGVQQRSPQTLLDALCSKIAFDPLAFSRMKGDQQNEQLRQLVGLDFTEQDRKREVLYSKRTDISREARSARARSESLVVPPATPAEPVVVEELLAQLSQLTKVAQQSTARQYRITQAQHKVSDAEADVAAAEKALQDSRGQLMAARMALKSVEREEQPSAPPHSTAEQLQQQIANAQITNQNVARRAERDRFEAEANRLEAEALALTESINGLDEQKRRAIEAAPMPVPGLALGETGPTLNGLPLDQASGAQKIRVSVALGLALNPRLKVLLIRDASLLDSESLAMVADMADKAGAQVWLERVGTGDPTAVIISDGQVDESAPANDAIAAAQPAE